MGPSRTVGRSLRFGHWSFMFAEIAIYSFAVLTVTGLFLMVYFQPDMTTVIYRGQYVPLQGVPVSKAFDSTMNLSFEVRGGLLMRQVHHWAALVFVAAVALQLLRMFVTGAYRKPRRLQWMIWVTLLAAGMAAGETGKILPDDMLSGGSLWLFHSVLLAIPVVGPYASELLFGGAFPGDSVITTLYWVHVLLIPVGIMGLLGARSWLLRRNGHTRFSAPMPVWRGARPLMAFATTGVLLILGALFQIAPIFLYGPANPGHTSAGAVPDWYMGFMDGAIRLMPGWEPTVFGYTLSLAVLVPAMVVPGVFFTAVALYPLAEERIARFRARRDALGRPKAGARAAKEEDADHHDVLERPRATPVRTGIAAAGVTFYGLLWAAAANDQIAQQFDVGLEAVTIFFRFAVIVGPLIAFSIARRISLGLVYRDRETAEHGRETGVIVQSPDGGFHEVHESTGDLVKSDQ